MMNEKNYIKNCPCYYFDVITKFEDFDLDNILIVEHNTKTF